LLAVGIIVLALFWWPVGWAKIVIIVAAALLALFSLFYNVCCCRKGKEGCAAPAEAEEPKEEG